MKAYPAYLLGLITGMLLGLLVFASPPAQADSPACVVGQDTVWNNPVCRDCAMAHMYDMQACTDPNPPAAKP